MGVMKTIYSSPALRRQYLAAIGAKHDEDESMCEFCGKVLKGNIRCTCNLEEQEDVDQSSRT